MRLTMLSLAVHPYCCLQCVLQYWVQLDDVAADSTSSQSSLRLEEHRASCAIASETASVATASGLKAEPPPQREQTSDLEQAGTRHASTEYCATVRVWGVPCNAWSSSSAPSRLSEAIADDLMRMLRACASDSASSSGSHAVTVNVRPAALLHNSERPAALLHQPHTHAHEDSETAHEPEDRLNLGASAGFELRSAGGPMSGVPVLPWRRVAPLLDEPRQGCPLTLQVTLPTSSFTSAAMGTCLSLLDGSALREVLGSHGLAAARLALRFSQPLVTAHQVHGSSTTPVFGSMSEIKDSAVTVHSPETTDSDAVYHHDGKALHSPAGQRTADGIMMAGESESLGRSEHAEDLRLVQPERTDGGISDSELQNPPLPSRHGRDGDLHGSALEPPRQAKLHHDAGDRESMAHATDSTAGSSDSGWSLHSIIAVLGLLSVGAVCLLAFAGRHRPQCFRSSWRQLRQQSLSAVHSIKHAASKEKELLVKTLSPSSASKSTDPAGSGAAASAIGRAGESDDESGIDNSGSASDKAAAAVVWASGVAGAGAMPQAAVIRRRGAPVASIIGSLDLPPVFPPASGPSITSFSSGAMGTPFPSPLAAAAASASPLSAGPFAHNFASSSANAFTASASAKSAAAALSPLARATGYGHMHMHSPHAGSVSASTSSSKWPSLTHASPASPLAAPAARFHSPTSSALQAHPAELLPAGPTLVLQSGASLPAQAATPTSSVGRGSLGQTPASHAVAPAADLEAQAGETADADCPASGLPTPLQAPAAAAAVSWASSLLPRSRTVAQHLAPDAVRLPQAMAPRLPDRPPRDAGTSVNGALLAAADVA